MPKRFGNNIDKFFKRKLENYEIAPPSSAANWKAIQNKLQQQQTPIAAPSINHFFSLKKISAFSGIAAIFATIIWLITPNTTTTTDQNTSTATAAPQTLKPQQTTQQHLPKEVNLLPLASNNIEYKKNNAHTIEEQKTNLQASLLAQNLKNNTFATIANIQNIFNPTHYNTPKNANTWANSTSNTQKNAPNNANFNSNTIANTAQNEQVLVANLTPITFEKIAFNINTLSPKNLDVISTPTLPNLNNTSKQQPNNLATVEAIEKKQAQFINLDKPNQQIAFERQNLQKKRLQENKFFIGLVYQYNSSWQNIELAQNYLHNIEAKIDNQAIYGDAYGFSVNWQTPRNWEIEAQYIANSTQGGKFEMSYVELETAKKSSQYVSSTYQQFPLLIKKRVALSTNSHSFLNKFNLAFLGGMQYSILKDNSNLVLANGVNSTNILRKNEIGFIGGLELDFTLSKSLAFRLGGRFTASNKANSAFQFHNSESSDAYNMQAGISTGLIFRLK